jgi:hypothetical protein
MAVAKTAEQQSRNQKLFNQNYHIRKEGRRAAKTQPKT